MSMHIYSPEGYSVPIAILGMPSAVKLTIECIPANDGVAQVVGYLHVEDIFNLTRHAQVLTQVRGQEPA